MFALPDLEGVETLYVVVKATFELVTNGVAISDEPVAVTLADEYCGEPGASSLRYASEVHLFKPGTDVVVVGDACAPAERPVSVVDVSVGVIDRSSHARVHGDRLWMEKLGGARPGAAKPFVRKPITYEQAYGGCHLLDNERLLEEASNPVGLGFVGRRKVGEMLGQPAPSIESLRHPIGELGARGIPMGFGPVAPSWEPRRAFGGTYDELWKRTRAPYLPADFNSQFFNQAPAELVFLRHLVGGEPVALRGFHPRGLQRFDLPRCEIQVRAQMSGRRMPLPLRLETVVLEPTIERFTMSWRAALAVDKKLLRIDGVSVSLARIEGIVQRREAG